MEFKTVFTSVRPARVAVFIDRSDVDWQDSALRIIEFFATLWGGRHSVIVPTDGNTIAPEFWAILECFDADYLFYYQKTLADKKIAKPDEYARFLESETDRRHGEHGSGDRESSRRMIDQQLPKAQVSNFAISPSLQKEITSRLVPFSMHNRDIGGINAE